MTAHYASFGEAAGAAMRHNAEQAARIAEARATVERPTCGRNAVTGQPCPDHPRTTDPLAPARNAARAHLANSNPRWRVVFTDSENLDGIAPVCQDETHDPTDGSAYSCCPDPVIECHSASVAAYLVALLNADADATADGEQ